MADEKIRPRVLLVDDAEDHLAMYSDYLASRGFDVACARDGEAAVEVALKETFDIIIVDTVMPKLDGIGLLMVLRNYSKTKRVPMISLSARSGEEARAAAVDAGANLAMEKPCSPEELEQTIRVFLRRRE